MLKESYRDIDFILDPSLVLYLPLHQLDGAEIQSLDRYGHKCTVNGALWTLQGYRFDGVDDLITYSGSNLPLGANPRTFLIWLKHSISQEVLIAGWGNNEIGKLFSFYTNTSNNISYGGWGADFGTELTLIIDRWHLFAMTSDGTTVIPYLDGVVGANGTPAMNAGESNFYLGRVAGQTAWKGEIAMVMAYNRVLSHLEIQSIYQATKWRYQ